MPPRLKKLQRGPTPPPPPPPPPRPRLSAAIIILIHLLECCMSAVSVLADPVLQAYDDCPPAFVSGRIYTLSLIATFQS